MTETGKKEILLIEKDPDGDDCKLIIDVGLLNIYHYLLIVELISDLGYEEYENRVSPNIEYNDDNYKISMPSCLYKTFIDINEILASKEFDKDEFISKI